MFNPAFFEEDKELKESKEWGTNYG
jgi:hypothetical protein